MPDEKRIASPHKARRVALQSLYWLESQPWDELRATITAVADEFELPQASRQFSYRLAHAAIARRNDYDRELTDSAENWDPDRIGRLEHLIVALALAEWDSEDFDTPPKVVLNEALTLAGEFLGEEGVQFINGVLDRLGKQRGVLA